MSAFDALVFRFPFLSEWLNQVLAKDLGLLGAWHFLSRAGVQGDYLEFGVYRGETFRNAMRAAHRVCGRGFSGRFVAFDSFQGLPADGSKFYAPGEFRASRGELERRVRSWQRKYPVHIVEGWFTETLKPALRSSLGLERAAFVNVDCDLYESTVPVLDFVTPLLQTGTILYFDDWYSIHGSMNHGEPKACAEWLARNPKIRLVPYRDVGVTGKMFIVNL